MKTFAVSALLVGTASIAESSGYVSDVVSFARSRANANYDFVMNSPNYVGDKGTDFGRWSAAKLSMEKPLREYKAWIDHMDDMTFSQKYMCTREKYKQAQEYVLQLRRRRHRRPPPPPSMRPPPPPPPPRPNPEAAAAAAAAAAAVTSYCC